MRIDILTLFPEIIESFLGQSIIKRAIDEDIVEVNVINFRDYSTNKHKKVDDYPYGGGAGMLLSVQPIDDALQALERTDDTKVILTTPTGKTYDQKMAERLKEEKHLVILCGHYEGIDDRVREHLVDEEISIGDYVLTGGELAALLIVDSVTRLIPGVLNKEASHIGDTFSSQLLEYPQYTRPREYKGMTVPDVLLSGNHKDIERYRMKESLRRTFIRRPDLLENYDLNEAEEVILKEIMEEESNK